jgi:hypothetical protein
VRARPIVEGGERGLTLRGVMFISVLWRFFSNVGELGSFLVVRCD